MNYSNKIINLFDLTQSMLPPNMILNKQKKFQEKFKEFKSHLNEI